MSDHERFSEELPAYVLGALRPGDAAELERHLSECGRCRAEIRWLRPAVDLLPAGVESRKAPPAVRRRVLTEVRADATRERRAAGRRGFAVRPAFAVATVAVLVGIGLAGYALRGPGIHRSTAQLQASAHAPRGASGQLVSYDGAAMLDLSGLPPVQGGHVYEAWVRQGQAIRPSTVFVPAHDGSASAGVRGSAGGDEVLVTLEPKGGSTHPTSAPLFTAPLG